MPGGSAGRTREGPATFKGFRARDLFSRVNPASMAGNHFQRGGKEVPCPCLLVFDQVWGGIPTEPVPRSAQRLHLSSPERFATRPRPSSDRESRRDADMHIVPGSGLAGRIE